MARVALLSPDLLFGSKVQGALEIAGHTVARFATGERVLRQTIGGLARRGDWEHAEIGSLMLARAVLASPVPVISGIA